MQIFYLKTLFSLFVPGKKGFFLKKRRKGVREKFERRERKMFQKVKIFNGFLYPKYKKKSSILTSSVFCLFFVLL